MFAHFNLEIPLNEPSTTATSSLSASQTGEKAISVWIINYFRKYMYL